MTDQINWRFPFERGTGEPEWALFDGAMSTRAEWEIFAAIDGKVRIMRGPGEQQFRLHRQDLFQAVTSLATDETQPEFIRRRAREWVTDPEDLELDSSAPDSDKWHER